MRRLIIALEAAARGEHLPDVLTLIATLVAGLVAGLVATSVAGSGR